MLQCMRLLLQQQTTTMRATLHETAQEMQTGGRIAPL
jgi:hypothetical protein